jgi:hypothetical protein
VLVPRLGTRPLIIAGAIISAGGLYWSSRMPVHGNYWTDIFPPLMITGLGLGLVFVGVQIAGNAGAPPDRGVDPGQSPTPERRPLTAVAFEIFLIHVGPENGASAMPKALDIHRIQALYWRPGFV